MQYPRLLLLGTGGTIAGTAPESTQLNRYAAGVIGAEALLTTLPQLNRLAEIQVEQITKEQNYQRYREERFRQTSESTNQRVLW